MGGLGCSAGAFLFVVCLVALSLREVVLLVLSRSYHHPFFMIKVVIYCYVRRCLSV